MNASDQNITDYLKRLTSEPGVYQMVDKRGEVIYVGKANNLKKRLQSYFNKKNIGVKTKSLVDNIAAIKVDVTRSETEALLLESNLIKALRPKYNVLLRDDKTYPYIHVLFDHPFPRMELYRSKKKPKGEQYFGPFPSAGAVRQTLNIIQKVFKIRNCREHYFNNRSRPCLQYQIGRCSAPCTQYISPETYQQAVKDALRFLQGKCQMVIDDLEARMSTAAKRLAFEEAALIRNQIKSLRLIQETQGVTQLKGDADVIAIQAQPGFSCLFYVTIREGEVIGSRSFFPSMPAFEFTAAYDEAEAWLDVFKAFISFHYLEYPDRIPSEILIDRPITEKTNLENLLHQVTHKPCKIISKPQGKKARWLEFALNNLRLAIEDYQASATAMDERMKDLARVLNRSMPIQRIECFDISHTQGHFTIASNVVFEKKGPNKNEYRRFNIHGIKAGDDYAALEQAVFRRLKNLERSLPDVLLIDGGRGQLTVVKAVLDKLNLTDIHLIGIAKGRDRKSGWEQLICGETQKEINLAPTSPAFHLLQQIRDEAHRFAITAHQKKRQKSQLHSSLEGIAGIGPKRRHALLSRFGGLRELAKAPLEEIAKVHGINQELAERIYAHFH